MTILSKSQRIMGILLKAFYLLLFVPPLLMVLLLYWNQAAFNHDCHSLQKNMALQDVENIMSPYPSYSLSTKNTLGYFAGGLNIDTFDECYIYLKTGRVESVEWIENQDGAEPLRHWVLK